MESPLNPPIIISSNINNSMESSNSSSDMDEDTLNMNMANMSDSGSGSLRHQDSHTILNGLNSQLGRPNLMSMVHHKWRKIWKRDEAQITPKDPSYKAVYLGNVVTTWAKGEGCLEKPASALWKNHNQGRGSIKMVISVCPSGLKAQTREHGLTEYWANRLTWCGVPPDYPKLFCWIYRHEGRKLKQELRCHAVLCSKEDRAQRLANSLRNRLAEALFDFKKEKILRQNARLSIVQCLYNTSATKRRLVLMNSNSQNYKPPLERSKSAPKLSCIEEFEEEDNEENMNLSHMTIFETEAEHMPVIPEIHSLKEVPHNGTVLNEEAMLKSSPSEEKERPVSPSEKSDGKVENNENEEETPDNKISRHPVGHRKSYTHSETFHPEGSRRPHTVPMDAKLNLPYMTGYDKVMHLLDMPTGDTHHLILDRDDGEFAYPFTGPNSDPVASSPGSDASESVVDSFCDEEYGGKHAISRRRRRSSCERKANGESPEDEINDNVSDESGYSEEAAVVMRRSSNGDIDLSLNLHPSGSPPSLKKSSSTKNNNSTSTIIITEGNEPVIVDALSLSSPSKTSTTTTTTFRSDVHGGPPTPCTTSTTTLVVYDNLCFEI